VTDWRDVVAAEWHRRNPPVVHTDEFPLMERTFTAEEMLAAVDTLLSGQLTMHDRVRRLETRFAETLGVPYAVMVNSGSSANLLAVAAAANPVRGRHLQRGDEVLVPAVCWSTSVWPFVQAGLNPVFVDVDPRTLNISIPDLRRMISPRTKAIMIVHVLGNGCDMAAVREIAAAHDLIVIEDSCESLGTLSHGRAVGTHGEFGTYSFYYSHHMTTGEGGMVVCQTLEDYDLLRSLRAHGWSRQVSNREALETQYADVDPRFLFINLGYNVRPLDVQAAIGLLQLDRLAQMNAVRNSNRERMLAAIRSHGKWRGQFSAAEADTGCAPAWFGLAMLLNEERPLRDLLTRLSASGVENRPIISGNFTRQPAWKRLGYNIRPEAYPGAESIHHRGFFIGIQSEPLSDARLAALADRLLDA
jgi:CDP-4-dehydro-6-deoxyglucose reductase, E1